MQFEYDSKVAMIHKLRVNCKSLAEEARIIRKEEERCGPQYRTTLRFHRISTLRKESRVAQLALAYVRGRPYKRVEAKTNFPVDPKDIVAKLKRSAFYPTLGYSDYDGVSNWLNGRDAVGTATSFQSGVAGSTPDTSFK